MKSLARFKTETRNYGEENSNAGLRHKGSLDVEDVHKTLAGKLRVLFEKGIKRDEPVFKALIDERPTWPADVHGLVAQHSVELTSLMLRHSTVIRIAYLVAKTLGRTLTPTFRKMAFGCIDKLAGLFSPSTRAILNARNAMVDLVLNDNMIEIAV